MTATKSPTKSFTFPRSALLGVHVACLMWDSSPKTLSADRRTAENKAGSVLGRHHVEGRKRRSGITFQRTVLNECFVLRGSMRR